VTVDAAAEPAVPRWVRCGFGLGAVVLAAQVAICLPPLRSRLGEHSVATQVLQDIFYPLAAALVFARAYVVPRERVAWFLLGCGLVSYSLGNAYWVTFVHPLNPEPPVTIADPLLLGLYPCIYASLLKLLRARLPRVGASNWLDGLIAAAAAAAIASLPFLGSAIGAEENSITAVVSNLAYPIADIVLVGCLIGAWALTGWRIERIWLLLIFGVAVFAVGDALSLVDVLQNVSLIGSWLEFLWMLGAAAMVAASWSRDRPAAPRDGRVWGAVALPGMAAVGCVLLLVYGTWRRVSMTHVTSLLAAVAVCAALARMMLTLRSVEALADARRQARTDDLTDLPNRRHFFERLDRELLGRDGTTPLAVAIIDLDRFKEVNDSFGHHLGDRLLCQVAERLSGPVGGLSMLARIGGDEFGLLLPTADVERASGVASALLAAMEPAFILDDTTLHVDASIGIAMYPVDGTDRAALVRHADTAMYTAKTAHRGFSVSVTTEDDDATRRWLTTLEELRTGLDRGELVLHYQPQLCVPSGRVLGCEALVRWNHPVRGLVYPDGFLPIAERAGLMDRITLQVLDITLLQCRTWLDVGLDIPIAMNLSASNLRDTSFPDWVADALLRHGVPARAITMEVTENVLMDDAEGAQEVLEALRELGIKLAVDDYGTGYSGLAYLHALPVDDLKLDRAFVRHCDTDTRSAAIVANTVDLAHSLGMRMIAEGVENEAVMDRLREYGCDIGQGYHLGRPQHPDVLTPWLAERVLAAEVAVP
jgi:diguanylate cyclase (GGDEF)-like protein